MTLKNTPVRNGPSAIVDSSAASSWRYHPTFFGDKYSMLQIARYLGIALICSASLAIAQQPAPKPTAAADALGRDTSYIDANGTAPVTRVVPVPQTISPEAQKSLSRAEPDQGPPQSLDQRRKMTDAYTAMARIAWTRLCPNSIVEEKMAGVPVRIVTPANMPGNSDKVLLNLHG